jgi:sugar diacid utilization regulator
MQKGYLPDWNYVVAVLDICDRLESESEKIFYSPLSKERLELFMKKIDGLLTGKRHDVVVFTDKDSLICVFSDMQEKQAAIYTEDILRQIKPWFKTSETIFTAVGSNAEGFLGLSKSYKMAVKIKNFAKYEHRESEILRYSEAGMYQFLFQIEDTDCFLDYYSHTIFH